MVIHVIINSHLDPVWAWRRTQGIDEVISTARTGCDVIDRYPEIIITRGEAWFYETLEKCAPDVFRRVAKHVENGRWHVTGGFYIQPDCNIPQAETLIRQGQYAQEYFEKKFGFRVKTGFNVDSFGHAASIPDIWNACGMENYVMQRPENAVLPLPGNLFEWHGVRGGKLNTYRLSRGYCTVGPDLGEGIRLNFEETLKETAAGVNEVMGFVGIGNHGGGPVVKEIEFMLEHSDMVPGCEIKFSTPDAYFEAVKDVEKPVWKDELQHHAVGCYSAVRRIKEELRLSENALSRAENCLEINKDFADDVSDGKQFEDAWKKLFFATFHDVLPGTSVKSAYEDIYDDLGFIRSVAAQTIEPILKRRNNTIPASPYQQLVFDNLSCCDFRGYVECEPWLGFNWAASHDKNYAFYDSDGNLLPAQEIICECAMTLRRFAVKLDVPALGRKIITIRECDTLPEFSPGESELPDVRYKFTVSTDLTDTWSHSVDRYQACGTEEMSVEKEFVTNDGALFRDEVRHRVSSGGVITEVFRRYAEGRESDLKLYCNWHRQQQVVKIEFTLPFVIAKRHDAIPGAFITRACNGKEYPVQGATALSDANGRTFVIAGNFSACDVQSDGRVRLTLLRTPVYSHHDPLMIPENHTYQVSGLGVSEFSLKLAMLEHFDEKRVIELREAVSNPLFFSEVTLGCKSKYE